MISNYTTGPDAWLGMSSAPRDGTVIEIRNSYGVVPWYSIFRWSDEMMVQCYRSETMPDGTLRKIDLGFQLTKLGAPRWVDVDRPGHSVDANDERYLHWRPASDGAYVDPTNGAQNTAGYWLKAAP